MDLPNFRRQTVANFDRRLTSNVFQTAAHDLSRQAPRAGLRCEGSVCAPSLSLNVRVDIRIQARRAAPNEGGIGVCVSHGIAVRVRCTLGETATSRAHVRSAGR